jgi:hypothetical protein
MKENIGYWYVPDRGKSVKKIRFALEKDNLLFCNENGKQRSNKISDLCMREKFWPRESIIGRRLQPVYMCIAKKIKTWLYSSSPVTK